MKHNSKNSQGHKALEHKRVPLFSWKNRRVSFVVGVLLAAGLTGCEALQRKFTRKPKHPKPPPSPIIHFKDYTGAMTPLDRYRKHLLIFDYWNDELIEGFRARPVNAKRLKHASKEALEELTVLQELVAEDVAVRIAPLIEARAKIDRNLQRGAVTAFQANAAVRELESQTRQIRREFFWRDVEDHLKPGPPARRSSQDARAD